MLALGSKTREMDAATEAGDRYYEADLHAEGYMTIGNQVVAAAKVLSGYRSETIGENEQYMLGGIQNLRGFAEETFSTGSYLAVNLEFRYIIGEASDLHLFVDGGLVHPSVRIYSPGIGLSLLTRAGQLRLDYAIGQYWDRPFSIQNGLIHLGIRSNF